MSEGRIETVTVGGVPVHGVGVDGRTRCVHYDTERDVIAIRFACCGEFYPCFRCHDAAVEHERSVWPAEAGDTEAVLCGACGSTLSIATYLETGAACPACDAAFNPGCAEHHHYYFEA